MSEPFEEMMAECKARLMIEPGDIYEDCSYHPVLCTSADYDEDELVGISLIDGSGLRSCSMLNCGVRKLTLAEALEIKLKGPKDPEALELIPIKNRWW